jgi:hypothetical protein
MWSTFKGEFADWAAQPFSEDMPLSHWFLFIGALLVIVVIWNIILIHLFEAIKGAA